MSFPWKTSCGENRTACAWQREEGRGVLACIHGLSGSGGQFSPVADYLEDYSVYAIELRGQGLDPVPERRAMVLDPDAQHRDIADFLRAIRAVHPGEPVYLFGESMGSLLVASFIAAHPREDVAGAILSVPVVELVRPVPGWVRHLVRLIGCAFPRLKLHPSLFVNGETSSPPLTRDRAYQDSLREQPHHIRVFTLRFLWELGELIRRSPAAAEKIHTPTLVLAAGNDCFVRVPRIEAWFDRIPSRDKTLKTYPDAYHLLWHDFDREKVLADVASWLKSRNGEK